MTTLLKTKKAIFALVLILFPFGQLLRINLTNLLPGLKIQPLDLITFFWVILWFYEIIKLKKIKYLTKKIFSKHLLFGTLFILISFISLLLNFSKLERKEFLISFFYWLRFLNYFLFSLSFSNFILENHHINLTEKLIAEGIIISFLSLFFYVILPDMRFLANFGWDRHYYRAVGPFLDPSFTALIISFSLLSFYFFIFKLRKKPDKRTWIFEKITEILMLSSLTLTFSRLILFSFFVSFIFLLIFLKISRKEFFRRSFFTLFIIFFVLNIAPKPGGEGVNLKRKSSYYAKMDSFKRSIKIFKKSPLFGVGFNSYRFVQMKAGYLLPEDWYSSNAASGVENSFLLVLSTTGILGFLAYFLFWINLLKFILEKQNKYFPLILSSLICTFISALGINSLFYPWVMIWLTFLFSIFMVDSIKLTQPHSCSQLDL